MKQNIPTEATASELIHKVPINLFKEIIILIINNQFENIEILLVEPIEIKKEKFVLNDIYKNTKTVGNQKVNVINHFKDITEVPLEFSFYKKSNLINESRLKRNKLLRKIIDNALSITELLRCITYIDKYKKPYRVYIRNYDLKGNNKNIQFLLLSEAIEYRDKLISEKYENNKDT